MPRRRAGPARSETERLISAGAAQSALGRGALHGAGRREVRGGAPGARRARARTVLAPRAGAAGGASVPRRPLAPCVLRSGRALRGAAAYKAAWRANPLRPGDGSCWSRFSVPRQKVTYSPAPASRATLSRFVTRSMSGLGDSCSSRTMFSTTISTDWK